MSARTRGRWHPAIQSQPTERGPLHEDGRAKRSEELSASSGQHQQHHEAASRSRSGRRPSTHSGEQHGQHPSQVQQEIIEGPQALEGDPIKRPAPPTSKKSKHTKEQALCGPSKGIEPFTFTQATAQWRPRKPNEPHRCGQNSCKVKTSDTKVPQVRSLQRSVELCTNVIQTDLRRHGPRVVPTARKEQVAEEHHQTTPS